MSILQETALYEPSVQDAVNQIKTTTTQLYRMMKQMHTQSFNTVWNNPSYTPQEIVTAFGTDAVALFTLSYQLQEILKAADPNYVILMPTATVTLNEDGTVTIGDSIV